MTSVAWRGPKLDQTIRELDLMCRLLFMILLHASTVQRPGSQVQHVRGQVILSLTLSYNVASPFRWIQVC